VNEPTGANPQREDREDLRKVEAGALNPYGASEAGQRLWSFTQRDERQASKVATSSRRPGNTVLRRGIPRTGARSPCIMKVIDRSGR
jgi:hypothetical protein